MSSNYEEQLKSISGKASEFDTLLTNIKKGNDELRDNATKVLENISLLVGRNLNTCKCCYDGPPQYIVIPCGHAGWCNVCARRAKERGRCFTCRGRVVDVIKYFL